MRVTLVVQAVRKVEGGKEVVVPHSLELEAEINDIIRKGFKDHPVFRVVDYIEIGPDGVQYG